MTRGEAGHSRWRRVGLAALVTALVLGALVPWPARRVARQPEAGVTIAAADERSPVRLAQRIKRGPSRGGAARAAGRARRAREARAREVGGRQAEPGRRRPQERGLHDLPHQDRLAEHAHGHDREARLHRLPRRSRRGPRARGRDARARRPTRPPRSRPTCCRATAMCGGPRRIPTHAYTAAAPGERRVHPVRQPGRPAGGAADVRRQRLPSERGRGGREEHDDDGADAVGRRALQQRQPTRSSTRASARAYGADGAPQRVLTLPPPTLEEIVKKGVLAFLDPLPRFEVGQPGNVLRVFERGQQRPLEIGIPFARRGARPARQPPEPARARARSTAPTRCGSNLQKTRLFDPALSFLGTNDHPGDYRSSGCTACHVLYANDRSPVHSGDVRPATATTGETATRRPDDPQGRVGPSDPAPVHELDPVEPVRRLPPPPRHHGDQQLPRLHRGGTTRPTAT